MESQGFKMPNAILQQLNEFSSGGFALFTYDDTGNPCVHTKFDTNKDAMALQMFVASWSEALHSLSAKSTLDSLSDAEIIDDEDILFPDDEDDELDLI
jgi:hypothetical protein